MRYNQGFEGLTPRERQIMDLFIEHGCAIKIGAMLGISSKTVHTYMSRVRDEICVDNSVQLAISYERWKRSLVTSGTSG